MNKCMICGKECSERAKTCSSKCRKIASRQSVTESKCDKPESVTVYDNLTITDVMAMTNSQTVALLEHWRLGNGTEYQRRLGQTAANYSVINGHRPKETLHSGQVWIGKDYTHNTSQPVHAATAGHKTGQGQVTANG